MAPRVKEKDEVIKKIKKRPREEKDGEGTSRVPEKQLKRLEEAEQRFVAKGGEYDKVKATLRKERLSYKSRIRDLEKELEEERNQRKVVEKQLQDSNLHLDQAVRETSSLRDRLHLKAEDPIPIPLPQCKECYHLIDHFLYLRATINQKDDLIKQLVQRKDLGGTKRMFEESKEWSRKNLCEGGPLADVDWLD